MSIKLSFLFCLIFFLLGNSFTNTIQASAVPVIKSNTSTSKQFNHKKKQLKRKRRKAIKKRIQYFKEKQLTRPNSDVTHTLLVIVGIAWYPIAIALLVTALVLGITPLLVAAIIMLSLPLLLFLILGLILIIGLATSGDWC